MEGAGLGGRAGYTPDSLGVGMGGQIQGEVGGGTVQGLESWAQSQNPLSQAPCMEKTQLWHCLSTSPSKAMFFLVHTLGGHVLRRWREGAPSRSARKLLGRNDRKQPGPGPERNQRGDGYSLGEKLRVQPGGEAAGRGQMG